DDGVADEPEDAAAEGGVDQDRRHIEDGVLPTPPSGVRGADRLVRLVQREQREAEGVLHPRAPEAIELAPEDRQGVGYRLVAVAEEACVEEVQAEGARSLRHVEVDDILLAR